jgi:N-dimethylarginine dimethylaminohydrolase
VIVDETSPLEEVLLGPPEHFRWLPTSDISKATLASGRTLAPGEAAAAHAEMVSAYEDAGVSCRFLEADPALPYQVFARDSSVWAARGPIVTQLQQWWRRGEYAPVIRFYEGAGIEIAEMVTAASLEGGDLVLVAPRVALLGHCEARTQKPAADQLAAWLRDDGWEVRLQPFAEHFVHIDVLVCMVAPSLAAVCEEAVDPSLLDWLGAHGVETIPLSYASAVALGVNAMALGGDRVLSSAGATELNEQLRARGLYVYDPDLSPFTLGGGGPHCLAQPLRRAAD